MTMDDLIYGGVTVERRPKQPVLRQPITAEAHALAGLGREIGQLADVVDDELETYLKQRERSKVIDTYGDFTTRSRKMMTEIFARRGRQAETSVDDAQEMLERDYRALSEGMSRYASDMFQTFYHSHRNTVLTQVANHQVRETAKADELSKQQALTNLLELMAGGPGMDGLYEDLRVKGIRLLAMQYPELEGVSLQDIMESNYPILIEEAQRFSDALAATHVQAMATDRARGPARIPQARALMKKYDDQGLLGIESRYKLARQLDELQDTETAWMAVQYGMMNGRTKVEQRAMMRQKLQEAGVTADVITTANTLMDGEQRRMADEIEELEMISERKVLSVIDQLVPDDGKAHDAVSWDEFERLFSEMGLTPEQKGKYRKIIRERYKRVEVDYTEGEIDAIEELSELERTGAFAYTDITEFRHRLRPKYYVEYVKRWSQKGQVNEVQTWAKAVADAAYSAFPGKSTKTRKMQRVQFTQAAHHMYRLREQALKRDLLPAEKEDLIHDMRIQGYLDKGFGQQGIELWRVFSTYREDRDLWRPAGDDEQIFNDIPQEELMQMQEAYEQVGRNWGEVSVAEILWLWENKKAERGTYDVGEF